MKDSQQATHDIAGVTNIYLLIVHRSTGLAVSPCRDLERGAKNVRSFYREPPRHSIAHSKLLQVLTPSEAKILNEA